MLASCACIFFLLFGVHHQFLIGTPSAQLLLKMVKNKEKPLQKHCGTRYGFTFHVWIFRLGKKILFPHSFQGNRYANTAGVSARRGSGKTGPLKKQKKVGPNQAKLLASDKVFKLTTCYFLDCLTAHPLFCQMKTYWLLHFTVLSSSLSSFK